MYIHSFDVWPWKHPCNYRLIPYSCNLWNFLISGTQNFIYLICCNSWSKWFFEFSNWLNGKIYFHLLQCLLLVLPSSYVAGNLQSALMKGEHHHLQGTLHSRSSPLVRNARVSCWILYVDGQHWFCWSQCYG